MKKKILTVFVVICIMLLLMSGCTGETLEEIKDQAKEQIEQTFRDRVESKINEVVSGVQQKIDNWFYGAKELLDSKTITYCLPQGIDAPKKQKFRVMNPKITESVPVRDGYHFTGWTKNGDGKEENPPEYFPGQKTFDTFTEDITLYACWEKYNSSEPLVVWNSHGQVKTSFGKIDDYMFTHMYQLQEEKDGKILRLLCSCGMEIENRKMPKDVFAMLASNGHYMTMQEIAGDEKAIYERNYIVYSVQDYAPMALSIVGSFYDMYDLEKNKISSKKESPFDDFFDTLKKAADMDLKIAQEIVYPKEIEVALKENQWDHDNLGYTMQYRLNAIRTVDQNKAYREEAEKFFKRISKGSKAAKTALDVISFARTINYTYDAFRDDAVNGMPKLMNVIGGVMTYVPYGGLYYKEAFKVLDAGFELYQKCYTKQEAFNAFLKEIPRSGENITGTSLNLLDIDALRNAYNVIKNDGEYKTNEDVEKMPSIMQVVGELISDDNGVAENEYEDLTENEKILVGWYLAMRMEYDFRTKYQITLKEYIDYFE